MKTWHGIAILVVVVLLLVGILGYGRTHWTDIINGGMCWAQKELGSTHHWHIPNAEGATFTCEYD